MALIDCTECHKQVSDKATACPHCGAPIASASHPIPASISTERSSKPTPKKTSSLTWLILIVLVAAATWYFPKAQREASLPTMPVEVKTRSAMTGPGLVLIVKNTSSRHLSYMVTLTNPTTHQERAFRVDVGPDSSGEIGYKEGWTLASGDLISISNNDYQQWSGSTP
jgi:transglutaminase/protease-like cytokinesis protein 3